VSSKRRFRGSWRLGGLYSERPLALRPRLATGVPSSRRYLHHRLGEAIARADWTIGRGAYCGGDDRPPRPRWPPAGTAQVSSVYSQSNIETMGRHCERRTVEAERALCVRAVLAAAFHETRKASERPRGATRSEDAASAGRGAAVRPSSLGDRPLRVVGRSDSALLPRLAQEGRNSLARDAESLSNLVHCQAFGV
jgi:hypothetical protein